VPDLIQDDLGGHVGGRVQAVDRDFAAGNAAGQLKPGHDLGELALAVGPDPAVAAFEHEVAEIERVLADGGDVDDAGRRRRPQQREQLQGEQEPGEVVHGEPQLVPVGAGAAIVPVRLAAANARVAHEHVEPVGCLAHVGGEPAHLGQLGQVGQDRAGTVRPPGTADFIGGAVEPSLVPAVQDQGGPVGGEPLGQGPAQAVGGAGDEDRWAGRSCRLPAG
jgi:hypothetical protein